MHRPTKLFLKVASPEIINKAWLSNALIVIKKSAEYGINITYVMESARARYLRKVVDDLSEIERENAANELACVTDETKLWLSSRLNYVCDAGYEQVKSLIKATSA